MKKEKISVCMATYNGARFIEKQLHSILEQLSDEDEVIIVDDCSSDDTVDRIRQFLDERVHVIAQKTNCGVVASFERALSQATGDIIFLADQDDVWLPGKVVHVCSVFAKNPNVLIVHHDAQVMDGQGDIIAESWFAQRRSPRQWGIVQTVLKNEFTGCMMAMRRDLVDKALPFPKGIAMHDQWLGSVALLKGKESVYVLDEQLLAYVRHGQNVTGHQRTIKQRVTDRWRLVQAIWACQNNA